MIIRLCVINFINNLNSDNRGTASADITSIARLAPAQVDHRSPRGGRGRGRGFGWGRGRGHARIAIPDEPSRRIGVYLFYDQILMAIIYRYNIIFLLSLGIIVIIIIE